MCGGWVGEQINDAVDFVTEDVPTYVQEDPLKVAALALAGYGLYSALTPGVGAGALSAADASFVAADAAQLAAQGLSEAQIAQTLGFAGADAVLAADAASLAAQGLSEATIAQNLAQQPAYALGGDAASSSIGLNEALRGAQLVNQLTAQPQQVAQQIQQPGQTQGSVNYQELLGLLNAAKAKTPNISTLLG